MFIKPTSKAKGSLFDIHDDAEDILLYPVNEDVPCPWDADVMVEGGVVTLSGALLPSGTRGAKCICHIAITDFSKYYRLEASDDNNDLLKALIAAGWEKA